MYISGTVDVPPVVPVPGWEDEEDEIPSAMLPVIPLPEADPHKSSDTPQAGMIVGVILGASVVIAAMITVSHTVKLNTAVYSGSIAYKSQKFIFII